ncbi:MAG: HU family DNA-binding protein [Planctomycetota bacterium]|nr:HU family DNA-binding protein [Planctomycetota bacterium]
MNQVELAQHLSKCTGIAGSVCGAVMTELFTLVRGAIDRNESVTIKGFGTFKPEASRNGYEVRFEAEPPAKARPGDEDDVISVTETRKLKIDSDRMRSLKEIEEAQLAAEAEEAIEATEADLFDPTSPPPDKPGYKIPTRSGLNPAMRSNASAPAASPYASAARSGVNRAADSEKEDKPSKSGRRSASRSGRNKAASSSALPEATPDGLTAFASDILGLNVSEVERGLGLAAGVNPAAHGRRLTFPVQISRQAQDASSKRYRPSGGDERRQFKDLALKNFFLSLGSIVRDRETHEPLIVFDVEAKAGKEGERYVIKLLHVAGKAKQARKAGGRVVENPHELRYEEKDFDFTHHEVLILIDEKMGPRIHGFDIGGFKDNDRRERAEICLAQEYENYQVERK